MESYPSTGLPDYLGAGLWRRAVCVPCIPCRPVAPGRACKMGVFSKSVTLKICRRAASSEAGGRLDDAYLDAFRLMTGSLMTVTRTSLVHNKILSF
jgi:hypothetical protein